jgi:hypothetical protein
VPEQLIVIRGAGASLDSTRTHPFDEGWRPPVVVDLFAERARFTEILELYPDAQSLAPDLRAATRTGAVGLETYLREHVREPLTEALLDAAASSPPAAVSGDTVA